MVVVDRWSGGRGLGSPLIPRRNLRLWSICDQTVHCWGHSGSHWPSHVVVMVALIVLIAVAEPVVVSQLRAGQKLVSCNLVQLVNSTARGLVRNLWRPGRDYVLEKDSMSAPNKMVSGQARLGR